MMPSTINVISYLAELDFSRIIIFMYEIVDAKMAISIKKKLLWISSKLFQSCLYHHPTEDFEQQGKQFPKLELSNMCIFTDVCLKFLHFLFIQK